eukprot:10191818-Karenia_brevis.AAC.1
MGQSVLPTALSPLITLATCQLTWIHTLALFQSVGMTAEDSTTAQRPLGVAKDTGYPPWYQAKAAPYHGRLSQPKSWTTWTMLLEYVKFA